MKRFHIYVLVFAVMTFFACGGGPDSSADEANTAPTSIGADSGSDSPRLLALPGQQASGSGAEDANADTPIHWHVPDPWVSEPPENSMRKAQYRIPGSDGDASLIVFYFGPGQGGQPQANLERWARQFSQPDGSDPVQQMKLDRSTTGSFPMWHGEIVGTYDGGMAMMGDGKDEYQDWMLLGVIVETAHGPWFFKLTGPQTSVEAIRPAFDEVLSSIHEQT